MAGSGLRFLDGFRDDIKALVPNGQKVALQLLIDIAIPAGVSPARGRER